MQTGRRDRGSLGWAVALLGLAGVLTLVLTLSFEAATRQGITADEPWFLRYAARFVETGDLARFSRSASAPLPALMTHVPALLLSGSRVDSRAADPACGAGREVLRVARSLNALVIGIPLLLAVFGVLARRHDPAAGLAGAALLGLSPSLLASLSLATTDACITLFVFASVTALAWHARSGSFASLLCASVAIGLAIGAKLSGLFLGPIAALVIAFSPAPLAAGRSAASRGARIAGRIALMGVVSLLVAWGVSGFQLGVAPGDWLGTPDLLRGRALPAPLVGLLRHVDHSISGHPTFLLGSLGMTGWWLYFPVVFAAKSTPAELAATALAGAFVVYAVRRWRTLRSTELREPAVWIAVVALYGASALTSTINLGHRHLLVLYPLLVCLAVEAVWRFVPSPRIRVAVAAAAIAVQAISAAGVRPAYPQYFNALAGGPERGYEVVVDSNLDWGQDLPALERRLTQLEGRPPGRSPRVQLFYFGRDCPSDYAIERVAPGTGDPPPDFVAISATYLQGVYVDDRFAAFRRIEPVARAGHSIFLYDWGDPAVRAASARVLAR